MSGATAYLVEPSEPDESITNGFVNPIDVFNLVSPSAWINGIIEKLSGHDIFGMATETFTGEWAALWKFGDSLDCLARFMQQIGIDIQRGAMTLDGEWDGNASDAAYNYFTSLAAATSAQQTALRQAAKGYRDAAKGAWQLSNQLGNLLQAIVDKAIIAAVILGASAATAEVGVGVVTGASIGAVQVAQLLDLVNRASMIINTAGTVILGAFGTAMTVANRGGDLSAFPLPPAPFARPGA